MTLPQLLLSPEGRISRSAWWLGFTILNGALGLVRWLDHPVFGLAPGIDMLVPFLMALLAYPSYCLHAKRFQDRDKHRAYALASVALMLVAVMLMSPRLKPFDLGGLMLFGAVGLWLIVELGCLRGTAGPNRFGEEPT